MRGFYYRQITNDGKNVKEYCNDNGDITFKIDGKEVAEKEFNGEEEFDLEKEEEELEIVPKDCYTVEDLKRAFHAGVISGYNFSEKGTDIKFEQFFKVFNSEEKQD